MSEHTFDYDPLQEQIRAALSRAAGVARDLDAIVPHVPRTLPSSGQRPRSGPAPRTYSAAKGGSRFAGRD